MTIQEVVRGLPQLDVSCEAKVDEQARAVLRYVLELDYPTTKAVHPDPTTCPNCDRPATSTRTPYCSDRCKEMSAFIRQFRGSMASGVISDPERQVAMGQKLWHLAGGGYPLRLTLAPASALRQVDRRTEGKCEICGNPAATYDHLGSG